MSDPFSQAPWGAYAPRGWRALWLRLLHGLPSGRIGRRLALWLRRPLKNRFGAFADVEVWGLRLRLRPRGNLSEQRLLLMPAYLDREEREALAAHLRDGGVFFDIGANAGVYSLWVASLRRPGVRVEAFEPSADLCALLSANLALNQADGVRVNNCALGRAPGVVRLLAGAGNLGENRVETGEGEGRPVPMSTLPAFLAEHGIARIDALKIDVEGHEVDVLAPLFENTPRAVWPRLLVCELTHDAGDRLAALLAAQGYRLAARGRLNGIYRLD